MSPIVSQLESICERWLVELFKLPQGTAAGFVSGSSTAIICGLAAARNELLRRLKWDVSLHGLFGAPKLRIVLGEQAHASVFKALVLLGIGQEQIEIIPSDNQGRMNIELLSDLDDHTILIAQAGNVNSGAFDNFKKISSHVAGTGAWFHIDGAFGLWSAASENRRYLTAGIEHADSWSVDAHKTLNAPYDSGIVLCKDRKALVAAMQVNGSYIQYSEKRDGMLYTTEMSRRSRAVELWATLKFLGRSGIGMLVDGLCNNSLLLADRLRANGFRILNEVVFNQVLIACDSPELTSATLKNIQQSGECWCGAAKWNGEPVIRVSVCSWVTTKEDIEQSAVAFVKAREMAMK
jgi:glutamate/tyrosine decarboxylase-like PLP-dependent enzyme